MRLSIDHGWYSNSLDWHASQPGAEEKRLSISGKPARIVSYYLKPEAKEDVELAYHSAIHFAEVDSSEERTGNRLTIVVAYKDKEQRAVAERIFRSIRFPH